MLAHLLFCLKYFQTYLELKDFFISSETFMSSEFDWSTCWNSAWQPLWLVDVCREFRNAAGDTGTDMKTCKKYLKLVSKVFKTARISTLFLRVKYYILKHIYRKHENSTLTLHSFTHPLYLMHVQLFLVHRQ